MADPPVTPAKILVCTDTPKAQLDREVIRGGSAKGELSQSESAQSGPVRGEGVQGRLVRDEYGRGEPDQHGGVKGEPAQDVIVKSEPVQDGSLEFPTTDGETAQGEPGHSETGQGEPTLSDPAPDDSVRNVSVKTEHDQGEDANAHAKSIHGTPLQDAPNRGETIQSESTQGTSTGIPASVLNTRLAAVRRARRASLLASAAARMVPFPAMEDSPMGRSPRPKKPAKEPDELAKARLDMMRNPNFEAHVKEWYRALLAPALIALLNPRDDYVPITYNPPDPPPEVDEGDEDEDGDKTDVEGEDREAEDRNVLPVDQTVFVPQVKSGGPPVGHPIRKSKILLTLRHGTSGAVTLRSGVICGEKFIHIIKSWPLSRSDKIEGLFREASLYQSDKHLLGDSARRFTTRLIGVFIDYTSAYLALEVPDKFFWMHAHPGMPSQLKGRALKALRAIHKQGILHGNIALHHVLIGRDGRVQIIDFTCAKVREQPVAPGIQIPFVQEGEMEAECQQLQRLLHYGPSRVKESFPPQRVVIPGQKAVMVRRSLLAFLQLVPVVSGRSTEQDGNGDGKDSERTKRQDNKPTADGIGNEVGGQKILGLGDKADHDAAALFWQNPPTTLNTTKVTFGAPITNASASSARDGPPAPLSLSSSGQSPTPAKAILRNSSEKLYINQQRLAQLDGDDETFDEEAFKRQWHDDASSSRSRYLAAVRARGSPLPRNPGIVATHIPF